MFKKEQRSDNFISFSEPVHLKMELEGREQDVEGLVSLPDDAWLHVFAFLEPQDLLRASQVNSIWNALASHNHVWRALVESMQPSNLYPAYTAQLMVGVGDEQDSIKQATRKRCERDQLWLTKRYAVQNINLNSSVRGVAISPKNIDQFSAAAYDGVARVFKNKLRESCAIKGATFNSTRWTCDGAKVAFGSHNHVLYVFDAQNMHLTNIYPNLFFGSYDRAPLAAHPEDPNILVGAGNDNSTLTVFDLRLPTPVLQWNPHGRASVRDMCFVESCMFPFSRSSNVSSGKWALASISETYCSQNIHVSDFASGVSRGSYSFVPSPSQGYYTGAYSIAIPPHYFGTAPHRHEYNTNRHLVAGGVAKAWTFALDDNQMREEITIPSVAEHYWKMRYNSNGTLMFVATDDNTMELLSRQPDGSHQHCYTVIQHQSDLEDCDIAPDDSYVITASQDGTVGVARLQGCGLELPE